MSIVIPTFNESANVPLIVDEIRSILGRDVNWEIVFVDDDSPDQTSVVARQISLTDRRIRVVRRVGRRGLSSAVVEGILSTASPFVVVMDADLQHDTSLLPRLLIELRSQQYDVVVGSRYVDGGGMGDWEEGRQNASRLATRIAGLVVRAPVKDVMSGFFGVRREAFDRLLPRLSNMGFKILLDLFASSPRAAALQGSAVHVPAAPAWRQQAGCAGAVGISAAALRQENRPHRARALCQLLAHRHHRHRGAFRRADDDVPGSP
ncbi:MAG: glycosyltransferase [Alphaproteobacteria bacterium]